MMEEQIYSMALTFIPGLGNTTARVLIDKMGSAREVFEHRNEIIERIEGCNPKIPRMLDSREAFHRAEAEMRYDIDKGIECIPMTDERYPARLRECPDAPLVLYYKGSCPLETQKVMAVVGTRRATHYSEDLIRRFMSDLREMVPEVLVMSGLAYGVDILAHRASLENGYNTIGVLAHGLDRIYPASHRRTAAEMVRQGGLLTEFPTGSNPDKKNFVLRNRIVAGMSDAVIVTESADRGGALITAGLAFDYSRECFAFPGRVGDRYSEGCNKIIRENKARLITSAEDFVKAMSWDVKPKSKSMAVQLPLFPDLTAEEELVVKELRKDSDGLQINLLTIRTGLPVAKLSSILFELEMKGVVRTQAGGMYRVVVI